MSLFLVGTATHTPKLLTMQYLGLYTPARVGALSPLILSICM